MVNNTSSSITPTLYVIINIVSLSTTIIGTCLSCMILLTLLLRKKTIRNVPLLLCTNNYILVFFLGIFEMMHNIDTLRGDLGLLKNHEEIIRCRIQAYIVFSLISAVYLACVLQVSEKCLRIESLIFFDLYRLSFDFVASCIRLYNGYLILTHI